MRIPLAKALKERFYGKWKIITRHSVPRPAPCLWGNPRRRHAAIQLYTKFADDFKFKTPPHSGKARERGGHSSAPWPAMAVIC